RLRAAYLAASISSSPSGPLVLCAPTTPQIYTLSLHDALPIYAVIVRSHHPSTGTVAAASAGTAVSPAVESACESVALRYRANPRDRKSTRLNSSHQIISYAVFCLKKKKKEASADAADYDDTTT